MATRDWVAIKDAFAAALPMSAVEREIYLAATCVEREDVASAVRELLRAHEDASTGFLEPGSIALRAAWLFREHDFIAGRFRVKRAIARGAMGEVYEVYDERLRLPLALKAIRPELLADPDTVERFRREVLVTRNITHPSICRVFDLVEHVLPAQDGFPEGLTLPCLTMELLQGTSLEDWLATRRPMPMPDALELATQIADALQTLHDSGVVHRDLKPSNVVIISDGEATRAVLTDFGLARPIQAGLFETQATVHGGAPFFMAPELFRGARPSPLSDVYALGLLVDELVTERRAFSATSLHGLLLQKLGDGPERASCRARGLSRTWDRVIAQCLEPEPARRVPTAREVVSRLREREHVWSGWRWPSLRRDVLRTGPPRRWWRVASYSAVGVFVAGGTASLNEVVWTPAPQIVAVARFANATGDPGLDYLATGTASQLGQRLSQMPGFVLVTAPTPDQLRVATRKPRYSVSGEIRRRDGQLAVTVRIGDMEVGTSVWAETFTGPADNVLDIEARLAGSATAALEQLRAPSPLGALLRAAAVFGWSSEAPAGSVATRSTANSAAFDAYLRGRALFNDRTLSSALQAIESLNRAVELDPTFAQAHAALADVQGVLMDLRHAPHDVLAAAAERHALRAIELNPDLAEAHLSLAAVRQMQWAWTEAEIAYRRAIELHPESGRAHRWYGGLLLQFSRFEEALERYRFAIELDPFDYPSQSALGHALFNAGRPAEAVNHLEGLLAQNDMYYARTLLGQIYAYLGASDGPQGRAFLRKALAQADQLRARDAEGGTITGYADLIAAMAWSYRGDIEAAAPYVARLEGGRQSGQFPAAMLARVFASQNDAPRAMNALRDVEAERDRELLYLAVSPIYAQLRNEPEFRALVDRLNLSNGQ